MVSHPRLPSHVSAPEVLVTPASPETYVEVPWGNQEVCMCRLTLKVGTAETRDRNVGSTLALKLGTENDGAHSHWKWGLKSLWHTYAKTGHWKVCNTLVLNQATAWDLGSCWESATIFLEILSYLPSSLYALVLLFTRYYISVSSHFIPLLTYLPCTKRWVSL